MTFVDTNYFLRYFLKDNKEQYQVVKRFFEDAADNMEDLYATTTVVFEVYWVLKSYYELRKDDLIETIAALLRMKFIYIHERLELKEALELHKNSSLDFIDSFHVVHSRRRGIKKFKTFDKKLMKVFDAYK